MIENKTDIVVRNAAGYKVRSNVLVESDGGSFTSGDILDANAVEKLVADYTSDPNQGIYPTIDFGELDSMNNTSYTRASKPCRYTVTYTTPQYKVLSVGTLDVFSDKEENVITQVFSTHYSFNTETNQFDFTSVDDTKVVRTFRTYTFKVVSGMELNAWSDWSLFKANVDDIADGSITTSKLADSAVTSEKIDAGAIGTDHI